jgi:hypothetical protein
MERDSYYFRKLLGQILTGEQEKLKIGIETHFKEDKGKNFYKMQINEAWYWLEQNYEVLKKLIV